MASSEINKPLLGGYPHCSPVHTPLQRPISQYHPQPTGIIRQKAHPTLKLQSNHSPARYNPQEWPSIQLGIPQMSPTFNQTPVSPPMSLFSPRSVQSPHHQRFSPISPYNRQSVDEYLESSQHESYHPSLYSTSSSSSLYLSQNSYPTSPVQMSFKPPPPPPLRQQESSIPPPPYSEKPTNTDSFPLSHGFYNRVSSFQLPPPPPPKDDCYR